jgi:hypothetical protein
MFDLENPALFGVRCTNWPRRTMYGGMPRKGRTMITIDLTYFDGRPTGATVEIFRTTTSDRIRIKYNDVSGTSMAFSVTEDQAMEMAQELIGDASYSPDKPIVPESIEKNGNNKMPVDEILYKKMEAKSISDYYAGKREGEYCGD